MIGAGDVFGELALLTPDARRTATVVSLDRTHTLALGSAQVAALRRRHPQIGRFLTSLLARHLSRTSALVLEALYLPVETRLARRLSQLALVYDGDIRLTQDDLASMAGTTRATANGVLRTLEDRGLLALRRGRISVLDPAALARAGC
jgi:CRP-like cAMP-binding protein